MPWMQLKFQPGIVKDVTRYGSSGTWVDGSLVRFRRGYPEKWMGWQKIYDGLQLEGYARSISRHFDLYSFQWVCVGTHKRFYVISDDVSYDVTPVKSSGSLGTDPFDATSGSAVVTVNHTSHGLRQGDHVIFAAATTFAGIPAGDLNTELTVTSYIDDDTYTVTVATAASSSASGGGASVTFKYLYTPGSADQVIGGGWGALGWGDEEWGGDPALGSATRMGQWSHQSWGEDLVANIAGGPIFYWDRTNPDTRMVDILDLASADGNAPSQAEFILVSQRDRHLLAFGCTEFGGSTVSLMTIRWCSQEDILDWDDASTTGTAGSLPLSHGSRLISAIQTSKETIVWSDTAMYSLNYIGAPYIFGAQIISTGSDIAGLKAAAVFDDAVYWMGRSGFYRYDGRVQEIDCPVWDYVSQRIDLSNINKVYCSSNRLYSEIIWFYQSEDGSEVDSYVALNTTDGSWSIGSLERTVWLDMDTYNNPVAIDGDGYIYLHETGSDDGSASPAVAIDAYIESAPIELSSEGSFDRGDRFMFIRRILPDITFRDYNDNINTPSANIVLKTQDKPGSSLESGSSSQVSQSATIPVETFTEEAHVRLRGRSLIVRIESSSLGTNWRLGVPRIDVRTDGQR